jgi:hypothetical protein
MKEIDCYIEIKQDTALGRSFLLKGNEFIQTLRFYDNGGCGVFTEHEHVHLFSEQRMFEKGVKNEAILNEINDQYNKAKAWARLNHKANLSLAERLYQKGFKEIN